MRFCSNCGSFCVPNYETKQSVCIKCGEKGDLDAPLPLKNKKITDEKIVVVSSKIKTLTGLPVEKKKCVKCGNMYATVSVTPARSEEDYETEKYRCTECNYTWRESN